MTGACRPTPPEWFARAYEDLLFRQHGLVSSGSKSDAAELWGVVLAEGEMLWQDGDMLLCNPKPGDEDVQSKTEFRVLVVPLVADKDTT